MAELDVTLPPEEIIAYWETKYGIPKSHCESYYVREVKIAKKKGPPGQQNLLDMDEEIKNLKYFLLHQIGAGGFGSVWKGLRRSDQTVVAIKIINLEESQEDIEIINREIMALTSAKGCSQLTEYLDSDTQGSSLWIVMEYMDGGSVRDKLNKGMFGEQGLEEVEIASIAAEILKGLCFLARDNKFHRDIKAANILISRAGEVKLADFGATAQLTDTTKNRSTQIGSFHWMSPEMFTQDTYDQTIDIWSLGITCIEMATGLPPFHNLNQLQLVMKIPRGPPPTLDNSEGKWSAAFVEFVNMCLKMTPVERPTPVTLSQTAFIKSAKASGTTLVRFREW